jgi:hypothetical protein
MDVEVVENEILKINLHYLHPGEFFEFKDEIYLCVEKNMEAMSIFNLVDRKLVCLLLSNEVKVLEQIEPLKLKYQRI